MQNSIHPADSFAGLRLRERRAALNKSQAALAASVGVSFQQIQKYENGTNRLSASRIEELAVILKVYPSYFFRDARCERCSCVTSTHEKDHTSSDIRLPNHPGIAQDFISRRRELARVRYGRKNPKE